MTITAAADDYDRFVFGQIKNNFAARIIYSLHYHMTTQVVGYDEEVQKDIRAFRRSW